MFRGFNLTGITLDNSTLVRLGRAIAEKDTATVKASLDSFVMHDGALDGSRLQENWFPQIAADVFISHSHNDTNLALALAGWLKDAFHLRPFVDSSVWGYANDLLKQVDSKYCLNPGGETYSYQKRNGSTSHIHMMLSTALGMMIDSTECLIFLNTPASITAEDAVSSRTKSPWLYAEVAMTRIIRRKQPQDHRQLVKYAKVMEEARAGVTITYRMDLAPLTSIDAHTLKRWREKWQHSGLVAHALDVLYEIVDNE